MTSLSSTSSSSSFYSTQPFLSKLQLGVIFHWGLYSVPAYDSVECARRRKIQNGSEWYLKRLVTKFPNSNMKKNSGAIQTQQFHSANYTGQHYSAFASKFQAEKFNPDEWMKLCKSIGATYVILTSKHHDGFCLWPTATTQYNSKQTAAKKDLVELFRQSALKHGLKFGLYYSWWEFSQRETEKYMNEIVKMQIEELATHYKPEFWWFDGDWVFKTETSQRVMNECCDFIRSVTPTAIINDRIGYSDKRKDPNYLGRASFRSYGDREMPEMAPEVAWEHINTIGLSWGRNKQQCSSDYKTPKQLFDLYQQVQKLNGNFLINLGPNSDGSLCEEEVNALIGFSQEIEDERQKIQRAADAVTQEQAARDAEPKPSRNQLKKLRETERKKEAEATARAKAEEDEALRATVELARMQFYNDPEALEKRIRAVRKKMRQIEQLKQKPLEELDVGQRQKLDGDELSAQLHDLTQALERARK